MSSAEGPHPVDDQGLPPLSLEIRMLRQTLLGLEWVGSDGEESCPHCGSSRHTGHASECGLSLALTPGAAIDAFDGAVGIVSFLTANQMWALSAQMNHIIVRIEAAERMVTRILAHLPKI